NAGQHGVVVHDQCAIAGAPDVELNAVGAHPDGGGERLHRVLPGARHPGGSRTSMGNDGYHLFAKQKLLLATDSTAAYRTPNNRISPACSRNSWLCERIH